MDFSGNTRPEPPSIGAMEYGSELSVEHISVGAAPNPAVLNQPVTLGPQRLHILNLRFLPAP